jgi:putative heme-binding domain-containing protein
MLRLLVILSLLLAVPVGAAEYDLSPVIEALTQTNDATFQRDLLVGLTEGTRGERSLPMPASWPAAYGKLSQSPDAGIRELSLQIALLFGDPAALDALRRRLLDPEAPMADRQKALENLLARKAPDLAPQLINLAKNSPPTLRRPILRALASFDHEAVGPTLLTLYPRLSPEEKPDAVQTLAARPVTASLLLNAVEEGVIPREAVPPFIARQIRNLGDDKLRERLALVWGSISDTPEDKRTLIHQYKTRLVDHAMKDADPRRGRLLFAGLCATCHTLYGEGGKIAPDLTGSNRADLQYLLENVLDPNAVIGREYQLTAITLKDGRVVTGTIAMESGASLTVQMLGASETLSKEDIAKREVLPVSMMPEGLFQTLDDRQLRDIVAYLSTKEQVQLPETTEPAHPPESP